MPGDVYIFQDAADAAELERLRLLESVFDAKSQAWLRSARTLFGASCLEVGAGAGSIAVWLASEVGSSGRVTAIDTNTRFLRDLRADVHVIEGGVGMVAIPGDFDVVHARYVLIHNTDAGAILDTMLGALRPSGVLVLEEPDFSAAAAFTGESSLLSAFDSVKRATRATFAARDLNYAFGAVLPALLEERGARILALEYDCPATNGGSKLAEMMRLSTLGLRHKYVATGLATTNDISNYAEFTQSAACWATYYATVRIVAQKPPADANRATR